MSFTYHEHNGLRWSCSDIIPIPHMFTERLGGVGDYPYSSKYDPQWLRPEVQQRVREQWLNLTEAGSFPAGLCFTHQVHGNLVRYVTETDALLPPLEKVPVDCDGLVTDVPGLPVTIFTADCVPVLLCDPEAGVAAAAHCGWKGTAKDMMGAAVRALTERGAGVENIRIAIGPAISRCCFEVGSEVPEAMEALLGADTAGTYEPEPGVEGKYLLDLKEVNHRRALQLGVRPEHIDVNPDCTRCLSERYWSHRATGGVRGTQAAVIMLPDKREG